MDQLLQGAVPHSKVCSTHISAYVVPTLIFSCQCTTWTWFFLVGKSPDQ